MLLCNFYFLILWHELIKSFHLLCEFQNDVFSVIDDILFWLENPNSCLYMLQWSFLSINFLHYPKIYYRICNCSHFMSLWYVQINIYFWSGSCLQRHNCFKDIAFSINSTIKNKLQIKNVPLNLGLWIITNVKIITIYFPILSSLKNVLDLPIKSI
jgi:hypothetical protein